MSLRTFFRIPLLCCLLFGCQSSNSVESVTGTETNWLKSCQSDGECGEFSCQCGVCTITCSNDSDCDMNDSFCGLPGGDELSAQCSAPPSSGAGLCLSDESRGSNATPSDTVEPTPQGASSGDASTQGGTPTSTKPSLSDDAATPNEKDPTPDAATSTGPTVGDAGAGTEPQSVDSGSETTDAGVADSCSDVTAEAPGGCCYRDSDCGSTEHCYDAECSGDVLVVGRCVSPPSDGQCFGDEDCAADEYCMGGSLAACGTLGPDSFGTCEADCEFDSCHPERCDEPGEPCCDPAPRDTVNYCNAGLVCGATGCERAETTTPEEQARLACEQTGGTWDYQSCGDYQCGAPPNCAAIQPGCNCGLFANFGMLGCEDDASCDTATQSFSCGEEMCASVAGAYCEALTGGPGITTYTCRDIPTACQGDAFGCECLLNQNLGGYECRVGTAGSLILVPPPAP